MHTRLEFPPFYVPQASRYFLLTPQPIDGQREMHKDNG